MGTLFAPLHELNLDVAKMDFDGNGLRDFFWPLSRTEQQSQRDTTIKGLVDLLRQKRVQGDEDARLLSMCLHWLVNESQLYFRATALERRCRESGVKLSWQSNARLLPAVTTKALAPVENGRYYSFLSKGPAGHPPLISHLVKLRRSFEWNGMGWNGWRLKNGTKDIIACYRCPLLDARAQQEDRVVKSTNLQDWFKPLDGRSILPGLDSGLIDQAIKIIAEGYHASGEVLPDYQMEYFGRFLQVIPGLIRTHYEPILKRKSIPYHLWTGSGGYIYNRMLRNAVQAKGGYVTGHEHASGDAHLAYFSAKPLIEYESADEFVTYSEDGAEALRFNFDSKFAINAEPPVIRAHSKATDYSVPPLDKLIREVRRKPKSLIYPTTMLMGERVNLDHIVGDNVMVDWSARLISNLLREGYDLIHKPHPEEELQSSRAFVEKLGVTQTWDRFEHVMNQADILVLDFSRSTIFSVALASNLPIVYVDFGFERWHPAAYDLLKKRVRIVPGWIDESNRMQVDWSELFRAINEASELRDKEIVYRFYPHLAC